MLKGMDQAGQTGWGHGDLSPSDPGHCWSSQEGKAQIQQGWNLALCEFHCKTAPGTAGGAAEPPVIPGIWGDARRVGTRGCGLWESWGWDRGMSLSHGQSRAGRRAGMLTGMWQTLRIWNRALENLWGAFDAPTAAKSPG